uniref:CHASE3 domain-containing protein n=1 Tax=Chitinimonas koreensis TaxID=356302 RepID=UPI00223F94F1|nr:hypothetical protein [Chitinimonas koreensis]
MKNLSFALRISAGFALLLVLMVAVAITGSWGVESQYSQVRAMVDGDIALNNAANELRYHMGNLRRFEKDSFINLADAGKVKEYRDKWEASLTGAKDSLKQAQALADAELRGKIDTLGSAMEQYAGASAAWPASSAASWPAPPTPTRRWATTRRTCTAWKAPSTTSSRVPATRPAMSPTCWPTPGRTRYARCGCRLAWRS